MARCEVNFIRDLAEAHDAAPEVLNPVKGCDPYGPGCTWCWAARLLSRFAKRKGVPTKYAGIVKQTGAGPVFNGELLVDVSLMHPAQYWKKRRVVFLNDLGDLFHPAVAAADLHQVLEIVTETPEHLYVLPTHRVPEAADRLAGRTAPRNLIILSSQESGRQAADKLPAGERLHQAGWRLGVSYEPALGPGGVDGWDFAEWVILGCLSGAQGKLTPAAFEDLARDVRFWCDARGIPFYLKQAPDPTFAGRVISNPALDGREHRGLWQP